MLTHTSYIVLRLLFGKGMRGIGYMLVLRKITLPMMKIEECKFQV